MVIRSAALADVENVVAADEDFAQLAPALPGHDFLGVGELHRAMVTRRFMYSSTR